MTAMQIVQTRYTKDSPTNLELHDSVDESLEQREDGAQPDGDGEKDGEEVTEGRSDKNELGVTGKEIADGEKDTAKGCDSNRISRFKRKKLKPPIIALEEDGRAAGDDNRADKKKGCDELSGGRKERLIGRISSTSRRNLTFRGSIEDDLTRMYRESYDQGDNDGAITEHLKSLSAALESQRSLGGQQRDSGGRPRTYHSNDLKDAPHPKNRKVETEQNTAKNDSPLQNHEKESSDEEGFGKFAGILDRKIAYSFKSLNVSPGSDSSENQFCDHDWELHYQKPPLQEREYSKRYDSKNNELRTYLQRKQGRSQHHLPTDQLSYLQCTTARCRGRDRSRRLPSNNPVPATGSQVWCNSPDATFDRPNHYTSSMEKFHGKKWSRSDQRSEDYEVQPHSPVSVYEKNTLGIRRRVNSNLRLRISDDLSDSMSKPTCAVDNSASRISDLLSATTASLFSPASSRFLQTPLPDSPFLETQSVKHNSMDSGCCYGSAESCMLGYKTPILEVGNGQQSCKNLSSISDTMIYTPGCSSVGNHQKILESSATQRPPLVYCCSPLPARSGAPAPRAARTTHSDTPLAEPGRCHCTDVMLYLRDRHTRTSKSDQLRLHHELQTKSCASSATCCRCVVSVKYPQNGVQPESRAPFRFPPHALPDSAEACKCPSNDQMRIFPPMCCEDRCGGLIVPPAQDDCQQRPTKRDLLLSVSPPCPAIGDPGDYPKLKSTCANPQQDCRTYFGGKPLVRGYTGNGTRHSPTLEKVQKNNNPPPTRGPEIQNDTMVNLRLLENNSSVAMNSFQSIEVRETYDPDAFMNLICSHTFRNRCAVVDFVKLKSAMYGFKSHIRTSKSDSIVFMCNRRRRVTKGKDRIKSADPGRLTTDCNWRVITSRNRFGYWVFKPTGNFDHSHPVPLDTSENDKLLTRDASA